MYSTPRENNKNEKKCHKVDWRCHPHLHPLTPHAHAPAPEKKNTQFPPLHFLCPLFLSFICVATLAPPLGTKKLPKSPGVVSMYKGGKCTGRRNPPPPVLFRKTVKAKKKTKSETVHSLVLFSVCGKVGGPQKQKRTNRCNVSSNVPRNEEK